MRYLPAEWDTHAATWIAWPVNSINWPGKMEAVSWVFAEMIRKMASGEIVYVTVPDQLRLTQAQTILHDAGCPLENVHLLQIPSSYGWLRDCGPQFILEDGALAVPDFHFNGWGHTDRYANWHADDALAARAARAVNATSFLPVYKKRRMVLEGGAIEVNGQGTLLTTEECLLDQRTQPRNSGFTKEDNEAALKEFLGVSNIIWLGNGILGDDTHGHIDDLARFVNARTIVTIREGNKDDANFVALEDNWNRLQSATLEDGSRPEVVALPTPQPLFCRGVRLPASYANFYICNAGVLVPTFNDPADREALGILAELFPDKTVCGVHALDLVLGRGTIHCLTRQQPVARG